MDASVNVADGTAWHAYGGTPSPALEAVRAAHPNKCILFTEQTAHGKANFPGDVPWSLQNCLLKPVVLGACCGLQWNLVLDASGGPRLQGGPGNCRGLVTLEVGGAIGLEPECVGMWHMCRGSRGKTSFVAVEAAQHSSLLCAGFVDECDARAVIMCEEVGEFRIQICSDGHWYEVDITGPAVLTVEGMRTSTTPTPGIVPTVPRRLFTWPSRFAVRSEQGTWLASHGEYQDCIYMSEAESASLWEQWTAVPVSGGGVVLRSPHGMFLGSNGDSCQALAGLIDALQFSVQEMPQGMVRLVCARGILMHAGADDQQSARDKERKLSGLLRRAAGFWGGRQASSVVVRGE